MSFLDSIVNTVSSAVSSAASLATTAATIAFPELAIAQAVTGLVSQVAGQAVQQAAQQLCQESGMPNFVQDIVKNIVQQVLSQLQGGQGAQGGQGSDCQNYCQDKFGDALKQLGDGITKSIVDFTKNIMAGDDDESSGKSSKSGKGGSSSWLIAMAKAMGKTAGEHAKKLADLSDQINNLQGSNGDQASKASELQSQMQAEGQMFGMLQNAFANVLKSIGDGMSTMARKG